MQSRYALVKLILFATDLYNECGSNPCRNGATCEDKVGDFMCHCVHGYSGDTCDVGKYICRWYTVLATYGWFARAAAHIMVYYVGFVVEIKTTRRQYPCQLQTSLNRYLYSDQIIDDIYHYTCSQLIMPLSVITFLWIFSYGNILTYLAYEAVYKVYICCNCIHIITYKMCYISLYGVKL